MTVPPYPAPFRQTGIRQRSLRKHCRLGRATELVFVLATGVTLTLGGAAKAQTVTWDGDTDDQWTTATNWSGDNIPDTATETAQIAAGSTPNGPVLTSTITVGATNLLSGQMNIRAGGTLNTATMTISQPGLLGIRDGGTLNAGNVLILGNINLVTGGALNGNVDLNDDGRIFVNGGTLTGDVNNDTTSPDSVSFNVGSSGTMVGNLTSSANASNLNTTAGQGIQGNVTISGGSFSNRGVISGSTTVTGGTLNIGSGSNLSNTRGLSVTTGGTVNVQSSDTVGSLSGAGSVTIGSAQTLTTGADNTDTTFSGVISGAGGLTKQGTGTFTLSGVNTYTGETRVSAGTLDVTGSIASGSVRVSGSATLQVDGESLSDTAVVDMSGFGILNLTGSETIGHFLYDGISDSSNSSVNLNTHTLTLTTGSGEEYSGRISGSGGLTVTGGAHALSRRSLFTGELNVTGGRIVITGVTSSVARVSGGELVGNLSADTALTISDTGTYENLGNQTIASVTQTGGTLTGGGTLTVSGDYALSGGTVTTSRTPAVVVEAGTFTMSGGTVAAGTTVNSAGLKTLSGGTIAGTLGGTGATTVQTGTVTIANTGQILGDVTLASGTLRLEGNTGVTGSITTTGSVVDLADGVNSTVPIVIASDTTQVQVATGTATQSGVISETGGARPLEKIGDGTLTLGAVNTYTGATTVSAGSLDISGSIASEAIIVNGGMLRVFGTALSDTAAVTLSGTGQLELRGSETIGSLASASADSSVALLANTLTTGGNDASTTFAGVISGLGGLVKQGTGTLTLTGANTYTGTTTISAGILRVTGGAAIADTSAVSVGAGTTLDVARSETIGSLAGEGAVTLASGQWLTAGGDNSSTTFSGVISGAGELIKAGSGTLTLSGANTYAGATTVSNGTLDVTGSIASSEIFLFSTGTLQVNGTALSDTATVRLDDASTLRLTGSATIGTLGGTNGTVDLGTHTLTLSAGSSFYNGLVSGTGGVTVTGGTQDLAGSNTFTGAVNVTGGSLGLNGVASTVAGVSGGSLTGVLSSATGLTISDTGTFRSTSDQTIASVTQTGGTLTGTRTLTVSGDYALRGGEVTTSGAPPLVVNAGTFTMSGGTIAAGTTVNSAGAKTLSGGTIAGTLGGTGATTVQTGTVTVAGTGQIVGDVTLASGTLRLEGNTGVTGSITTTGSVVDLADGVNSTVPIVIDSDTTQVQVATGTATQSGVISETGGARPLEKIGDGTLILSGANTYTGLTTISAGTLRLTGGAAIADTGAVSLTAGTTLRVDQSETIGALTNLGTVDLSTGNGTADTVLTVNGNSAAAAGSVLRIDTMLGDDSAMSDRVVIAGDTSGTTSVFVNVTGGDAAQTTSGILLVDVAGASDGTFVLANGDTTLPDGAAAISTPGGVFLYTLRQSGGNWLLQSQLTAVSVVYEALPSTLLGLMQSQTLAQRLSGRRMLTDGSGDEGGGTFSSRGRVPTTPEVGAWLDIRAAQLDVTPGASTTGLSWDQRSWRAAAGIDTVLHETMGGMLVGGISLTKGSGRVDAISAIGAGRIDTDAVGIGLSATWYGTGGFYADVELGWQDFESDLSTPGIGVLATGVGGKGHYASVEIGQSLAMGNLTLIPQAELSWTKVSLDGFTGAGGLAVAQSEAESRKLRLGLAAERNWLTGNGGAAQVYGIANVTREFGGDTTVVLAGTPLSATAPDWTADLGFGGAMRWQDGRRETVLFGEIMATRGFGSGAVTGLSGSLGLRLTW